MRLNNHFILVNDWSRVQKREAGGGTRVLAVLHVLPEGAAWRGGAGAVPLPRAAHQDLSL